MRIFHNTTLHLSGSARSFGGVVLGNFLSGVRCFHPRPVSTVIGSIGGVHVMLGLVAQATDVQVRSVGGFVLLLFLNLVIVILFLLFVCCAIQMLYAAVKALVCVVTTNAGIMLEMEKTGGFQVSLSLSLSPWFLSPWFLLISCPDLLQVFLLMLPRYSVFLCCSLHSHLQEDLLEQALSHLMCLILSLLSVGFLLRSCQCC